MKVNKGKGRLKRFISLSLVLMITLLAGSVSAQIPNEEVLDSVLDKDISTDEPSIEEEISENSQEPSEEDELVDGEEEEGEDRDDELGEDLLNPILPSEEKEEALKNAEKDLRLEKQILDIEIDESLLEKYQLDYDFSKGLLLIKGYGTKGNLGEKTITDLEKLNKIPEIKNIIIVDEAFRVDSIEGNFPKLDRLQEIGSLAFEKSSFSGSFPELKNLEKIGNPALYSEGVFYYSKFSGEFPTLENLKSISNSAFYYSNFSGEFPVLKSLESIGNAVFAESNFTGDFPELVSLRVIGTAAFNKSKFQGQFLGGENLESIGSQTFQAAKFTGEFPALKNLKSVGMYSFSNSEFTGNFPKLEKIEHIYGYAFSSSEFLGEFPQLENLISIGHECFKKSKFVGNFPNMKGAREIGRESFLNSKFTDSFPSLNSINYIGERAFRYSQFSDHNLSINIRENAFEHSQFGEMEKIRLAPYLEKKEEYIAGKRKGLEVQKPNSFSVLNQFYGISSMYLGPSQEKFLNSLPVYELDFILDSTEKIGDINLLVRDKKNGQEIYNVSLKEYPDQENHYGVFLENSGEKKIIPLYLEAGSYELELEIAGLDFANLDLATSMNDSNLEVSKEKNSFSLSMFLQKLDEEEKINSFSKVLTRANDIFPVESLLISLTKPEPEPDGGGSSGASQDKTQDMFIADKDKDSSGSYKDTEVRLLEDSFSENLNITVQDYNGSQDKDLNKGKEKNLSDIYLIEKDKPGDLKKDYEIIMKYDKDKVDKDDEVAIYHYDEEKKEWNPIETVKDDREKGKITGRTDKFGKFVVRITKKGASDLEGHWAKEALAYLQNKGCIVGYPDGTIRPDQEITRAEFISILVCALDLKAQEGASFSDSQGHWAEKRIKTARYYDIADGYDQEHFGPDDLITREQIASLLAKAGLDPDIIQKNISGDKDTSLRPQSQATRAEAAGFIYKAVKK